MSQAQLVHAHELSPEITYFDDMATPQDRLESLAQSLASPETSKDHCCTWNMRALWFAADPLFRHAAPERRLDLGRALHGQLDILQTPAYGRFLKVLFPVIAQLLQQIPLQQQPGTCEHKLRRLLVDILQRLPQNETIKPYIHELLRLALRVTTTDNEENALICMHIFSDILRTHKPTQDAEAAVMFLDFVKKVPLSPTCQWRRHSNKQQ